MVLFIEHHNPLVILTLFSYRYGIRIIIKFDNPILMLICFTFCNILVLSYVFHKLVNIVYFMKFQNKVHKFLFQIRIQLNKVINA